MRAYHNVHVSEIDDLADAEFGRPRAQTRLPVPDCDGDIVPTYVTIPGNDKSGVIIGDPHQRHWELLAYAGPMPDPKDTGLMDWCTLVLQGLSIKYPDSSSQERLDKLVNFADFCRKTHD